MKFETFKFENIKSTNDEAINLIKKEKRTTGCVYANMQTAGRGTHGRKWISIEGNLFLSIFFTLEKNHPPFNEFSIINPILITDVIKNFCKEKKISIKFPNDIFLNEKKIGGILQELINFENKNFLIIGIGINLVSHPCVKEKYETTNIFIETNKKLTSEQIKDKIISCYEKFFISLKTYEFIEFKKKAEHMASK